MFGLHRRTRSLIPVKDLAKYDRVPSTSAEDLLPPPPPSAGTTSPFEADAEDSSSSSENDDDFPLPASGRAAARHRARRQLLLALTALLAAATTAASLHPSFTNLLLAQARSAPACADLAFAYARSVLDCAFALGTTAGAVAGRAADARGRRPVVVAGLFGMAACCFGMGAAGDSFWGAAAVEVAAGVCWAAAWVGGVAALGDLTAVGAVGGVGGLAAQRVGLLRGLPAIGVVGALGPAVDGLIGGMRRWESWERVPLLRGRVVSGLVVLGAAVVVALWFEETLRVNSSSKASSSSARRERAADSEKAAFLGQDFSFPDGGGGGGASTTNGSAHVPSIRIVDSTDVPSSSPPPSKRHGPMPIRQFFRAPSFLALLASFSLLSLHAATFDVLLPHLGHNPSRQGGLGIPCAWLSFAVLAGRAAAAAAIFAYLPRVVARHGVLRCYRACSALFPPLYALTPALALLAASAAAYSTSRGGAAETTAGALVAAVSAAAIAAKQLLADAAGVLVVLLSLAAAPDARSTGTLVGLMQAAALCRSLAFAAVGAATFLAENGGGAGAGEGGAGGWTVGWVNAGLWAALAATGVVGSVVAGGVKERMSVGRDFEGGRELPWEVCFEAEDI